MLGQHADIREQLHKAIELVLCRELGEQEKIYYLLKAEPVLAQAALDDILNVYASVKQLAVGRDSLAVHYLVLADLADVGQSRQHALTVEVAQSYVYVIF